MELSSPQKKMIALGIFIALLGLLLIFLAQRLPGKNQATQQPPANQQVNTQVTTPTAETAPIVAETRPAEQRNMIRFAMQFAERYGSYSTESNYQNLRDLLPVMTPALQARAQAMMSAPAPQEFMGVTTQSIGNVVEEMSDGSARITVSTQRQETKGTAVRVYTQELELQLVKQGESYLVDAATWKQPEL